MKKKITSIAKALVMPALVGLLFSSCSKNELEDLQPANNNDVTVSNISRNTVADFAPSPYIPADAMISITRGSCMGSCPSYRVTVSANGDVVFTGLHHVSTMGTVMYKISPDAAYQLGSLMEHGGFFNFADSYAVIPDAQRNETSLVWNKKIKTVVDYGINVPQELVSMREKVEDALKLDRFIYGGQDSQALNNTQ